MSKTWNANEPRLTCKKKKSGERRWRATLLLYTPHAIYINAYTTYQNQS